MFVGEQGVLITLPVNNPAINISTYTCTMKVGRPDGIVTPYSVTPDASGAFATYTTTGTEFPIAGVYNIDFHVRLGGNYYKSRVPLVVNDAYS